MQAHSLQKPNTLWVLGTGGTISGLAEDAADVRGYTAGQVGVDQLLAGVALPSTGQVKAQQIAQVDSKDMTWAIWLALLQAVRDHLAEPETKGVVITHGTDTMEETAYFLHLCLGEQVRDKAVVLTGAMLPASAAQPDGPQNIAAALRLAADADACGVMLCMAGEAWSALEGQKLHGDRLDAFGARAGQAVALVSNDGVVWRDAAPLPSTWQVEQLSADAPWVEIVVSGTQPQGSTLALLHAAGLQGAVVATTGNGTVHEELQRAAEQAYAAGLPIVRASRTAHGHIQDGHPNAIPAVGPLSPFKARVAMMVALAAGQDATALYP